MIQTSTLLILICLTLAVISINEQDIHATDVYEGKGQGSELTGALMALRSVLNRLGFAPTISGKSLMWPLDMASINEIESIDFFPPYNVNTSTTTEKPDVVPGSNNTDGDSDDEWITSTDDEWILSTTDTTTKINKSTTTEKPSTLWGLWINSSGIVPESNNSIDDSYQEGITSNTTTTTVTTTDKPDIMWQFNNSDIVPGTSNEFDESDDEWITLIINSTISVNASATNATENSYIVCRLWFNSSGIIVGDSEDEPNTKVTIPGHPTCSGVAKFINAQLPHIEPILTNFTKMIDPFSKEIMDHLSSVFDMLLEVFEIFENVFDSVVEIFGLLWELFSLPLGLLDSFFSEQE
ncbi:unnamed protein product, partial [Meganyctiphanes norvegica]